MSQTIFDIEFESGQLALMDDNGKYSPRLIYGSSGNYYFVYVRELGKALQLASRMSGHSSSEFFPVGSFTSTRETESGGLEISRYDFGRTRVFRFSPDEFRHIRHYFD